CEGAPLLRRAGLAAGRPGVRPAARPARRRREQNVYTRYFRNVLHFRNVEAARESVARIDRLYNYFERLGDRAGQHQAMVMALTGKNRARWSGKLEESQVFSEWLAAH
ncbi:MAG TPA: hypothetical protein VKB12_07610, partial [Pyrinomonadaceae bacterium]|nr:hypothetical protein [Pyrinomonadaceae bacterium]